MGDVAQRSLAATMDRCKMERPVVRLEQALYGHPDAGTYWEEHCDKHCRAVGFEPIQDWPSCYWHNELQLLLVIYVDDFKMSGPTAHVTQGWALLKKGLSIEAFRNWPLLWLQARGRGVQTSEW